MIGMSYESRMRGRYKLDVKDHLTSLKVRYTPIFEWPIFMMVTLIVLALSK